MRTYITFESRKCLGYQEVGLMNEAKEDKDNVEGKEERDQEKEREKEKE